MSRRPIFLCLCLAAAACNSPVAPTPPRVATTPPAPVQAPSGPPAAVLVVERFSMYRISATSLSPSVQVRETGGKSFARVDSLAFNLADGEPWTSPRVWPQGWSVAPGGTTHISDLGVYGDPEGWFLPIPADYTGRVAVEVRFVDSEGRKGSVVAVAGITDPSTGRRSGTPSST